MPTWTGAGADNNWSTAGNWDTGVPSSVSDAIFNGNTGLYPNANKNCIITLNANCRTLNCTGYAGTITFTNTLTVNMQSGAGQGDITFSAAFGFSMVGPNGISYVINVTATTRTITTNGYNFNLPFSISGLGGSTLNLVGNFQVSNFTGANVSITGNELRVSGNWSSAAFGSALKVLNGTGTMATNSNVTNLVINAPGFTRTFSGSIQINNSIVWTAGALVTTGSTLTMVDMTTVNFGGQSLNNVSFSNSFVTTISFPTDLYVLGNLTLPNGANTLNGPGKVFIAGNLSNSGGNTGNLVLEMNGTGTINNIVPLNLIINTTGIITTSSTNDIRGNLTLTAGTLNLANNLRKRGATITLTSGITFTGSGNLVFQDYDFIPTTHTIVSNNVSWPNSVSITPGTSVANTLVLSDNFTVLGNFSCLVGSSGNQAHTINGNTLFVRGDFTVTTTGGVVGTTNIIFEGSTSMNWSMSGQMQNNLTINKSGGSSVSIFGTFAWGLAGRTLQRTVGNINPGTSTITIPNAAVTINNMVFNNLTVTSGATITQNILNTINSTLLLSGNATFAGTAGWTTFSFTHGGAGTTCTLKAGVTYTVQGGIFTMIGTAALRATLQSDDVFNTIQASIPSNSSIMTINSGTMPSPATGYVFGSTAFSTSLPTALLNILPDRPTIVSQLTANTYQLATAIGSTTLSSYTGQLGKKAIFNVFGTTNVVYAQTRDIDSLGGITIYAGQSFPDSNTASPNQFRTLNWEPLIAPSGSVYYTWVD